MITLHHLEYSRSTRVLWLLEELGIPFEMVRYPRTAQFRAPPELKAIHPLGKSPVLVDGNLTIAESATILRYLESRYGTGRFTPAAGTDAHALHDEWLDYVESTAGMPVMMTLIGGMLGGLPEKIEGFIKPGVATTLDYIAAGIGDGPFLMGDRIMLADMQMTYTLDMARNADMLDGHPTILAYLDRLKAQPGLQKAIDRGGPMAPPKR